MPTKIENAVQKAVDLEFLADALGGGNSIKDNSYKKLF